jgi:hypothetical protein
LFAFVCAVQQNEREHLLKEVGKKIAGQVDISALSFNLPDVTSNVLVLCYVGALELEMNGIIFLIS